MNGAAEWDRWLADAGHLALFEAVFSLPLCLMFLDSTTPMGR